MFIWTLFELLLDLALVLIGLVLAIFLLACAWVLIKSIIDALIEVSKKDSSRK